MCIGENRIHVIGADAFDKFQMWFGESFSSRSRADSGADLATMMTMMIMMMSVNDN